MIRESNEFREIQSFG